MAKSATGDSGGQKPRRITMRYPALVAAFGDRLRKAIPATGLRQYELAEALGEYRPDAISLLVNGKSTQIAVDMVIRLAELMDSRKISLLWLFTGQGEMTSSPFESRRHDLRLAIARKVGVDI